MVHFVNKIEFNDQKCQINGTVIDNNYKGEFLFAMKEFVTFITYRQSMFYMSSILLKLKINGVYVSQFKLYYIFNTTHTSHEILVHL